ncbi:hypothetical protein KEM55_008218 [Ascosphaera atra]|nr:hypothetical protein KEM55_008218 [Ascosphaera atra]
MFSLPFRESQSSGTLSIVHADCSPDVLEAVLCYLYTDKADFPLAIAVDVLWTADLMMIERLKNKAAVVISALGNGSMKRDDGKEGGATAPEDEEIDVYSIIHAGWATRVQRLEQFAARYLAYRLESHIDLPEFRDLVIESAERIKGRQETDTIELIDDIRYYLNERFRLRFDDPGFKQMLDGKKSKKEADGEKSSEEHVDTEGEEEGEEEHETSSEASTQGTEAGEDDEHSAQFTALDGRKANDEFQRDTMDYEILIDKLDELLDKLDLGA